MTRTIAARARAYLFFSLFVSTLGTGVSGCVPVAPAAAQSASAECRTDGDCVLVDVCGCECHAAPGPTPPPVACSKEACGGHPCEGHRAACASGRCVMR